MFANYGVADAQTLGLSPRLTRAYDTAIGDVLAAR